MKLVNLEVQTIIVMKFIIASYFKNISAWAFPINEYQYIIFIKLETYLSIH